MAPYYPLYPDPSSSADLYYSECVSSAAFASRYTRCTPVLPTVTVRICNVRDTRSPVGQTNSVSSLHAFPGGDRDDDLTARQRQSRVRRSNRRRRRRPRRD